MAHALGVSNSEILSRDSFSHDEFARIDRLISRRESGEPLQYILGEADFYGRDFHVGPGVLIPRADTESLINAAMKVIPRDKKFCFLDWGTGTGCIAITILMEFMNSCACMLENSPDALRYAMKNLSRYDLNNRAQIISRLDENFCDNEFDLLISNPPYIPSCEIASLMKTVRDYEPHSALDGGVDGMKFYRFIFSQALKVVKHEGYIILEAGDSYQVNALKTFAAEEFEFMQQFYDYNDFPRALVWRRRFC